MELQTGYYWAKYKGEWFIFYYIAKTKSWFHDQLNVYTPREFDRNRILNPDEKTKNDKASGLLEPCETDLKFKRAPFEKSFEQRLKEKKEQRDIIAAADRFAEEEYKLRNSK